MKYLFMHENFSDEFGRNISLGAPGAGLLVGWELLNCAAT
jgi:hypothetical protein